MPGVILVSLELSIVDLLENPSVSLRKTGGGTMAFNDPIRPGIDRAEPLPSRHNPASAFDDGPRVDGWTAKRPRNSNLILILAGGITAALMIAGWVTYSGMGEIGSATNTPPTTTSQPTAAEAPTVAPGTPATTGQAPAR
jgi:hypothetical protein